MKEREVVELIESAGGTVKEIGGPLPDGSGFATASFPLPKTHWIYAEHDNVAPSPIVQSCGANEAWWRQKITAASRYAVRCSTRNGKEMDFDPDALVQNMLYALLGPRRPTSQE